MFTFGLASNASSSELVIGFSLDTPPFVMDAASSGISVEIVSASLKLKGYTLTPRQMSYAQLADAVVDGRVDAATMVVETNNGTYFSDNYITFRNFAITMKSAGLQINEVADLKGKSIVAWENAYKVLGPEFKSLFSPTGEAAYRKKYREIPDQKDQVEMFWRDEAEVIVIDKSVMAWFTKELAEKLDVSAALEYHPIFGSATHYRVNFKNKKVRDDFNEGLEAIRLDGEDQGIYDKYLK